MGLVVDDEELELVIPVEGIVVVEKVVDEGQLEVVDDQLEVVNDCELERVDVSQLEVEELGGGWDSSHPHGVEDDGEEEDEDDSIHGVEEDE